MFKLTKSVNDAIKQCLETGYGEEKMDNKTTITAEWISKSEYDIITVYISQNGCLKCSLEIEETKELNQD